MKINRENYEAWFLDYIEGKLNSSDTEILMNFLSANPDLKVELENFETVSLVPEPSIFPTKENLKKNVGNITAVTEYNFDELCVAKIEGTLDQEKEIMLLSYLQQHPEKEKHYKSYQKTILQPDLNIVFDSKRRLKHYTINRKVIMRAVASVAATALLFFMAYYFSESDINNNTASIINNNIQQQKESVTANGKLNSPENIISEKTEPVKKIYSKKTISPVQQNIEPVQKRELETLAYMHTNEINLIANSNSSDILKVHQLLKENFANTTNEQKETTHKKKFDLWALAQLGTDGVNSLTGLNIVLVKTEDTGKNRKRVEFEAGLLSFYSSSDKK